MSGVPQLSASDITETSVLLLWTPPGLQYETYYVTFSSQVGPRLLPPPEQSASLGRGFL